ncbi:Argonaute-binding protein 1 [Neolecta irregularis DAH-3]|uniref:Argonaute-binding protein 1 n=1 Tax=Neolecta irregularis (strain DAH-3) TaxID=1198029 RepID=A0A1U7LND3_NEOID|nr:Argonaute-binding protein 1 [Neolecta irregularis DAH-3]|eukprot:OLL24165.1 Argonaute-binding protein 1 [Neolecta irregularis DAH-3]
MGLLFDPVHAAKAQDPSSVLRNVSMESIDEGIEPLLEAGTEVENLIGSKEITLNMEVKKKKKKKKKNKQVGTGFEEFYADAPVRPLVAQEEESLYSTQKSPATRMEIASERYRKNRKWDIMNGQIFSAYLYLGGIQISTRTGSTEEATSSKFVAAAGKDIDFDRVDFEHVVALFLSYYMGQIKYWTHGEYLRRAPIIVTDFLRYARS